MVPLFGFIGDFIGFCEVVPILMNRSYLKSSPGWHEDIDADGVIGSREFIPFRSFAKDIGKAEFLEEVVCYFFVLLYLSFCICEINMAGMCFEEMDLSDADERPCLFGFISEGVDDLEGF